MYIPSSSFAECEFTSGVVFCVDVNTSVGLDAGFVSGELGFTVGGSYSMHTTQVYPIKCIWSCQMILHMILGALV